MADIALPGRRRGVEQGDAAIDLSLLKLDPACGALALGARRLLVADEPNSSKSV
jgi:hypothetical protein